MHTATVRSVDIHSETIPGAYAPSTSGNTEKYRHFLVSDRNLTLDTTNSFVYLVAISARTSASSVKFSTTNHRQRFTNSGTHIGAAQPSEENCEPNP